MIVFNPIIPLGLIVLIALVFLALIAWVQVNRKIQVSLPRQIFLLTCRVVAVLALLLLLLQPSKRETSPMNQKEDQVAIVIDNSKSMKQDDVDGVRRIDQVKLWLHEKLKSEKAKLKFYTLAEGSKEINQTAVADVEAEGPTSHINDGIMEILKNQNDYSLKGLVLLSDGHNFDNSTPMKTARAALARHCNIFALAVGDKGKVKDLSVKVTTQQEYSFTKQSFILNAYIQAVSCEYETVKLELYREQRLLKTQTVQLTDQRNTEVKFSLSEAQAGNYEYEVRVSKLNGEVDFKNNQSTTYCTVLNSKLRALLIEAEPHWESSFLRRHLQKNARVHLDSFTSHQRKKMSYLGNSQESLEMPKTLKDYQKYDVVILGKSIDRVLDKAGLELLKDYLMKHGGVVILARNEALKDPSIAPWLSPVVWDEAGISEVQLKSTQLGEQISLKSASAEKGQSLPNIAYCRKLRSKKSLTQVLITAEDKYGNSTPAVFYRRVGRGQVLSSGLSGLWRWTFNKKKNVEKDYYLNFWDQHFLWLIANSEFMPGQKYSLHQDRRSVQLDQEINFQLSCRENYEGLKANLEISSPSGQSFTQALTNSDPDSPHRFSVSFKPTEVGAYLASYKDSEGKKHQKRFYVFKESQEEKEVSSDVTFLKRLAEGSSGRLIQPDDLSDIDKLIKPKSFKQAEQERVKLASIWDSSLFLYLICTFMAVEWFFRRKWGLD